MERLGLPIACNAFQELLVAHLWGIILVTGSSWYILLMLFLGEAVATVVQDCSRPTGHSLAAYELCS